MPEQEKQPAQPQPVQTQTSAELEATPTANAGASSIKPTIIIPPTLIAVIMSFCLAMVYGVTKEPIAEAKRADKLDKLRTVMPQFDNNPLDLEEKLSEADLGKPGSVFKYTGTVPDGVSGYGITSAVGTGYAGYFSVVFGVDAEGNITKVKILETMETPGLGSKAGLPDFIDQFDGASLDSLDIAVTKDGGDIDAVTGATITSRAVCAAVKQGLEKFESAAPGEEEPKQVQDDNGQAGGEE